MLNLLTSEKNSEVLGEVGQAFGHLQDPRGVEPLSKLGKYSNWKVRFGVAQGLWGQEDPLAVKTLIELSKDKS